MESLSKIVAIFLACILMFLYPTYSYAQKEDQIVQTYVSDKTAEFVNAIRNSGTLTAEMYNSFTRTLINTGNAYEIKITHQHGMYYPIIDDVGNVTGDVELKYLNTYQDDIVEELYNGIGEYKFSEGDYISISIKSTSRTLADIMQALLLQHAAKDGTIYVSYGGRIRDEN